uniref:Secreted protein n=1 Tax=Taenia asiatica TaxID=60517 RepID=A0A0R3WE25_TAEAS
MSFCYPLSLLHTSQACRIGICSSNCLEIGSKCNLNIVDGASWPSPSFSSVSKSRVTIREPLQSSPSEAHSEKFPLATFAESCSVGPFTVAALLGGFTRFVRRRL